MKEIVLKHLMENDRTTAKVAAQIFDKLARHPDILAEYAARVAQGPDALPAAKPVEVEGYTAQRLLDSTYLKLTGAYTFLVYLREKPAEALADLKKGLPRK